MQLEGVIITPQEVLDDATLFQRAGDDLAQKRYAEAARKYDTLLQSFPGSRLVLPALYNAGLAYEGKDEYATAAERYRALSERFPDTKDAVDARYKLGACYAELKNWPASKEAYARLYERTDLSLSDRLEALARRGYAEFNLRDVDTAERTFRQVLALFHEHETEERLDTDFFVAMAQYHLGAVAQARYDAIALHLPEQKMAAEMELKAGLLLDAQAKYIKTVRVGNAHWAAAAGFQIGALYRSFYDVLVGAPMPDDIARSADLKQVYLDELKKKIRPLLEKAVRTHEQTLLMAERAGLDNDWVHRSSAELEAPRRLLAPEASWVPRADPPPAPRPLPPPPGRKGDLVRPPG